MLSVWAVWVPRSSLNFACRPENKKTCTPIARKDIRTLAHRYVSFVYLFSISPSSSPGGLIKQPLRNGRTEHQVTPIKAGLIEQPLRSRWRTEQPQGISSSRRLSRRSSISRHIFRPCPPSEIYFLSPFCFLFSRSFITWVVRPGNELPRSWPFIEAHACFIFVSWHFPLLLILSFWDFFCSYFSLKILLFPYTLNVNRFRVKSYQDNFKL